jgi:hypothetical protein
MSTKNSNDTIGNRSRDLPVCSAVPQPLRHRVPPQNDRRKWLNGNGCERKKFSLKKNTISVFAGKNLGKTTKTSCTVAGLRISTRTCSLPEIIKLTTTLNDMIFYELMYRYLTRYDKHCSGIRASAKQLRPVFKYITREVHYISTPGRFKTGENTLNMFISMNHSAVPVFQSVTVTNSKPHVTLIFEFWQKCLNNRA